MPRLSTPARLPSGLGVEGGESRAGGLSQRLSADEEGGVEVPVKPSALAWKFSPGRGLKTDAVSVPGCRALIHALASARCRFATENTSDAGRYRDELTGVGVPGPTPVPPPAAEFLLEKRAKATSPQVKPRRPSSGAAGVHGRPGHAPTSRPASLRAGHGGRRASGLARGTRGWTSRSSRSCGFWRPTEREPRAGARISERGSAEVSEVPQQRRIDAAASLLVRLPGIGQRP